MPGRRKSKRHRALSRGRRDTIPAMRRFTLDLRALSLTFLIGLPAGARADRSLLDVRNGLSDTRAGGVLRSLLKGDPDDRIIDLQLRKIP